MPGPAPKPTALKLIEGNPGKRKLPVNEPTPVCLTDLTPPAHLSPAGAQVWDELAPRLRQNLLLTELDTLALEWLCEAAAQHRLATQEIGDKFIARNAETGGLSLSPWLIVQSMAFKRAKVLCDAFGMTPSARSRVVVNPKGGSVQTSPDAANNSPGRFFGS